MTKPLDYSDDVREHDSRVVRVFYLTLGFSFAGIGVAGALLPLLPATPFFLLAAACFARASKRFYNRLLSNPVFGPTIRDWRAHRAIPYRTKIIAIGLMSATLASSTIFLVEDARIQAGLALLGALLATWMWRIPSRDRPAVRRTAERKSVT